MKKLLIWLEGIIWSYRCRYGYWLHGPYGLSKIVEKMPFRFNVVFLKKYGASIGENCRIERGINIHRPFGENLPFENLMIGANVYIGHSAIIDLSRTVNLNNSSSCGSRVQIWTHASFYDGLTIETSNYNEESGPVVIGEGALVYSNSVIKHGVTIGRFASIGSCSIVNKDVDDYAFASGVPIKVILRTKTQDS